jgi:hypothetical protein
MGSQISRFHLRCMRGNSKVLEWRHYGVYEEEEEEEDEEEEDDDDDIEDNNNNV